MDKVKDLFGTMGKRTRSKASPPGFPSASPDTSPTHGLAPRYSPNGAEKCDKGKKSPSASNPFKAVGPAPKEKVDKKGTFTRATSDPTSETKCATEKVPVTYLRAQSQAAEPSDRTLWGRKVSEAWAKLDFDQCEPEICVGLLRIPAMKTYTALNKKLKSNDPEWFQGFLEASGLEVLLDAVDTVGSKRVQLSDAMMLLECVACIKTLMNSKMGVEYMIEHSDYTKKLVKALDTSNVMVKKQIFEILSALCVYSEEGAKQTLDALECYKSSKNQRYRFSVLINEMRSSNVASYLATLLGLVNCLILANESLEDRVRMRNEFIALNLLDLINSMRDIDDDDVQVQCDVFYDEKQEDEESWAVEKPHGLDLNSHTDVFNAVFQKVCNTPQAAAFLSILQSLLQIENDNKTFDLLWSLADRAVQKAMVANNATDGEKLLSRGLAFDHTDSMKVRLASVATQTEETWKVNAGRIHARVTGRRSKLQNQYVESSETEEFKTPPSSPLLRQSPAFKQQLESQLGFKPTAPGPPPLSSKVPTNVACDTLVSANGAPASATPPPLSLSAAPGGPITPPPPPPPNGRVIPPPSASSTGQPVPPTPPPPPPPPPPPVGGIPPPPPPPPLLGGPPPPPPPPPIGGAPVAPPPPLPVGGAPPPPPLGGLPPSPGMISPLTSPILSAIPPLQTIEMPRPKSKMKTLNWTKVNHMAASTNENIWKEVLSMDDPVKVNYNALEELFAQKQSVSLSNTDQERRRAPTEIALLDMRRSMNVNIFLKQFKMNNAHIIELIKAGDDNQIGIERLKGLIKILPQQDEVDMIKDFEGDQEKLGNAERFFLLLIGLKDYRMRIDGILLKMEFGTCYESMTSNIDHIAVSCRGILQSQSLRSFLRFILHTGNFINCGGYAGNAIGFKLSSLPKLTDTRANKPRVTLLHYLVEEAEQEKKDILAFVDDLTRSLTAASRLSVDSLQAEARQLENSVKRLSNQIQNASDDIKLQFASFVERAEDDLKQINIRMSEIHVLTKQLAERFCEDVKTFKVEECLDTFKIFCEKVKQCQHENEQRKAQEEKAEKRRLANQALSQQKKDKFPPPEQADGCIIDRLLKDIKRGASLRRTGAARSTGRQRALKSRTPRVLEGRERTGRQVFLPTDAVSEC